MSNKGVKQPKPKKQRKKAKKIQPQRAIWKIALGGISGALALTGGVVAVLTLLPRISVTPSDPVDPSNTFSAAFTISNNNFIPLRHVTASLGIGEIQPVGRPLDLSSAYARQGGLVSKAWADHSLDMDDKFTITPNDLLQHITGPREASITIVVDYQPWVLPWPLEKKFRFATHKQSNGNLYWYSIPES